ncbi:MAG: hypothetical protein ACYC53_06800, partial [Bacillota bacterium]
MCASANWDTELPEGLRDFLSADAFRDLSDRVSRGEAVTTVTERHVIKVRPSAQPYYLKTLANEREFFALDLDLPIGLPKVILADFTETRGILVLEKMTCIRRTSSVPTADFGSSIGSRPEPGRP